MYHVHVCRGFLKLLGMMTRKTYFFFPNALRRHIRDERRLHGTDSSPVLPSPQRNIQARAAERQRRIRGVQWRHDDILHASHQRHGEGDGVQARRYLPPCQGGIIASKVLLVDDVSKAN